MGNITSLNDEPWICCTRSTLKTALDRLRKLTGAELNSTFEQEFQFLNSSARPLDAFTLRGFTERRAFAETLLGGMREAGISPDSFVREYGPDQCEVTCAPSIGYRAADEAVMIREISHMVARRMDEKITFTPILDVESVGNGVHIHFSFTDVKGAPITYDPDGPGGMSSLTAAFAAGVLKYLHAIVALTAPSAISYERLTPHRWSAAYNNLGLQDREASLRICPVTAVDSESVASQFNLEFRAADAAASPHLALAALVHAGCQGIEDKLQTPPITEEDLSLLSADELSQRGYVRLPGNLSDALDQFEANDTVTGWFGELADIYVLHKRAELEHVAQLDLTERCAAYREIY